MGFCPKCFLLVLLIIAVILDIIAVAIPYWTVMDLVNGKKVNIGLWKYCVDGTCEDVRAEGEVPTYRGLHMFALIVGVVTVIVYIVAELVGLIGEKIRNPLIAGLSIIAGAFILIANISMARIMSLYPGCHVPSLISAAVFIFVGGFRSSADGCIGGST